MDKVMMSGVFYLKLKIKNMKMQKMKPVETGFIKSGKMKVICFVVLFFFQLVYLYAQDGNAGAPVEVAY